MFLSDNAVKEETQDILNRAGFSKKFAEEILHWKDDESIVIALYGDWGKGKTSILNIALSHIEQKTKTWKKVNRPIIIRFNPWSFSDQDSLLLAFFRQLFSSVHPYITTTKKTFQKEINGFAKALGAFEKTPIVGSAIGATRDVVNLIAPQETLETLRNNVDGYFKSLKNKVIIVIDDIDRLTSQEIAQIFQLVKINANFPNTIYLTAFDRNVVEMALNTENGVSGRDYLEKIIQVGFDVPAIEQTRIEKFLSLYLDEILNNADVQYWNHMRWGNFYHSGFKKLFKSIRDVKRFINSLSFNLNMVAKEINAIDFVGIEAVRVFLPKLYSSISENKELFTSRQSSSSNQKELSESRARLDEIFSLDGEHDVAKNICLQLFPQIRSIYPQPLTAIDGNPGSWRKDRRICHEDMFDIYFVLGTPSGEVPITEVKKIISLANDSGDVISALRNYISQGKTSRLFDLLSDLYEELSENGVQVLGHSLLEVGDNIQEPRAAFDLGSDFRLQWLLYHLLSKIQDANSRYEWFLHELMSSKSLHTPALQVAWNIPTKNDTFQPVFDDIKLAALKEASVKKIQTFSTENGFLKQKNLSEILIWWKEWSLEGEDCLRYIDNVLENPQKTVLFVSGFVVEAFSHTFGDYVSKKEWRLNFETLKKLTDIEKVRNIISLLSKEEISNLSEKEKVAIEKIMNDHGNL